MKNLKIAIIDTIGLTYDANTLTNYGLGGSESAIIYMAEELKNVGFDVTVFNNCSDSRATPGTYNNVRYIDLQDVSKDSEYTCDILIVSRTAVPYLPENTQFTCLKNSAKLKILWLHDTFCQGDEFVEDLIVNGYIDEIFTLSDFHTNYILNCNHGKRRNFEVLKNKTFITRNGAKCHIDEVDISAKDRNIFIYNASATKGMVPLLNNIWPEIKKHIPAAKLQVIGGYYRFRDNAEPDEQENTVRAFAEREDLRLLDVEFTGIIPQKDIAQRLAKAGFMLFPNAFPETFGISSLESLLYNTPIITNRFGALEETAIDLACYKMEYAIQPNVLFPDINFTEQCRKFIELTLQAYHNPYLYSQKINYCNIVKPVAGWDTVALQWKQHFFRKLELYFSADEYRKVTNINTQIHKIFNRRFSNTEEYNYTTDNSNFFAIITPFYNAENYIENCILSVASQDYNHYRHYLIDDASTDNSYQIAKNTIEQLPQNIRSKFVLTKNEENKGALYNQVNGIMRTPQDNTIIMLLDGDDCLMPQNDIFKFYNNIYDDTTDFTYGSCWSMADNIPLIAQEYPEHVKKTRSYRKHKFSWNMPYTHFRTFRKKFLMGIPFSCYKDEEGKWFKAGGDTALFYNVIEKVDPKKIKVIQDIVYKYNDLNPLNDYKVRGEEQTKTANKVLLMGKQRILLAIPTAKYIESETFKSIYDLEVPDNVELTFQYFFGYQIDQIRNLIAHWAKDFDYLFSVDSDIILPPDTLKKFLKHDVDIVSGVYIQRKPNTEIIEVYRKNEHGGVSNVSMKDLMPIGLHEIDGCGFGCVLVKSEVIKKIGYPQFVYKSALDHKDTISEDVYFCKRAQEVGAKVYVDSSVICNHLGTTIYRPDNVIS